MNLLNTSFERKSYEVELRQSILFECVLGIAMITYPKLHDQLEKSKQELDSIRMNLSEPLSAELQYCQEHNTWKMLLQLLHEQNFDSLKEFHGFITNLSDQQLKYLILPYLDQTQEENRFKASHGDGDSENEMILACKGHAFFPQMIHFIGSCDLKELRNHFIEVTKGWYREFLQKQESKISGILERDQKEKENWINIQSPKGIVLHATGVDYKPEAGIITVLLIPQYIYRPWTIQANLEDTKVFYYPVSDESLNETSDPYEPPAQLVKRLKAIGDEKRLRIMKLLSEKERTLKELTAILGMGKTTVHHHLSLLRTAGMVKVTGAYYSIPENAFQGIETQIDTFFERS
ncbi:ArsR/SmtB family transcription factor [Peribacillus frigoritolerans]|uniref:ArsR/SmtB family transcription factor n=1 Tax=Peribacillus frigoritolerans TaxID=450367 RepID=UPI00105A4AD8|nr:metalloregulator ArsR/SmtB family transcription factor [Peribacillus frigoritolerans]TDL82821.1 ArsR family transcriptional regulator [Peribacillus frigoritolerans]